jgi:Organic Anion Transporter Polypeptide (OATP) family
VSNVSLLYIHTPFHDNFCVSLSAGFILVSSSMFFASLIMFTFPKNLRSKTSQVTPASTENDKSNGGDDKNEKPEGDSTPRLKDFAKTIKRQIKNDILMFRTASAVLHLLPITGLYVFLPKYLEVQFKMPSSDATFVSGTFGILFMGLGIFITGIISVKYPLSAKKVSLWIAFTALVTAVGLFILSLLGCPMDNYRGLEYYPEGS